MQETRDAALGPVTGEELQVGVPDLEGGVPHQHHSPHAREHTVQEAALPIGQLSFRPDPLPLQVKGEHPVVSIKVEDLRDLVQPHLIEIGSPGSLPELCKPALRQEGVIAD